MSTLGKIVYLPTTSTSDQQLEFLANELNIPVSVYMNDEIVKRTLGTNTSSIVNLQSSVNPSGGSHWVCCVDVNGERIFFDSFSGFPSANVENYLRTTPETSIKRSFVIVQAFNSQICGSLCLYVIKKLFSGQNYGSILLELRQKFENNDQSPLWIFVKN